MEYADEELFVGAWEPLHGTGPQLNLFHYKGLSLSDQNGKTVKLGRWDIAGETITTTVDGKRQTYTHHLTVRGFQFLLPGDSDWERGFLRATQGWDSQEAEEEEEE